MDYINSDKLLFISASPAGSGYRLGRIVSCFDNVYWYANTLKNGDYPWDVFHTRLVKGKDISPYHFDRRTLKNMIPLLGERIECYWDQKDIDLFYTDNWSDAMTFAGADEIIKSEKYIVWVVHDTPQYLLSRFPNAKVINLVDEDVNYVIERYLTTTAMFPATIENKHVKPTYDSEYALLLKELTTLVDDPTYRDVWSWERYKLPYSSVLDFKYKAYVTEFINKLHDAKSISDPRYINVSWSSLDLDKIQNFLGSKSINKNVKQLMEISWKEQD